MNLLESESVQRWSSRLRPSTAESHLYHFNKWLGWVKVNSSKFAEMTPNELLQYQRDAPNGSQYDILDLAQSYVLSLEGRASSKRRVYASIRSFFLHNRAALPRDMAFNIMGDVPKVVGDLEVEEVRKMILSSNQTYAAAFLCMFQSGMGKEEFINWNLKGWPKLRENLKGDPDVIRIDLPGRKRKKNIEPYYTYIGSDAIRALRLYLGEKPAKDREAIFMTKPYGDKTEGTPLTKNSIELYWDRHLVKLGLVEKLGNGKPGNRYGKSLHELRDCFRSQWEKSSSRVSIAEFFMGHGMKDPNEYNKAFRDETWARGQYVNALSRLNIMSDPKAVGRIEEDEVKRANKRIAELEAKVARYESERETMITREEHGQLLTIIEDMKRRMDEYEKTKS